MKSKISIYVIAVMLMLGCLAAVPAMKAEAAGTSSYNLVQSVKKATKSGTWVRNSKGWWYEYRNGKYPKNRFLKINEKIYRFNKKGYMVTGTVKYKGSYFYFEKKKKNQGALVTGWKTISGKKYYFAPATGARLSGWQKIGKYTYYFNSKGVMQKNCTVDGKTLNAKGRVIVANPATNTSTNTVINTAVQKSDKLLLVGDSRTVGLANTIGLEGETGKASSEQTTYLGKIGEGYDWFVKTAYPKLTAYLELYPSATVVINLGVNDLGNVSLYTAKYKQMISEYPSAKFYFLSVNPIEEGLAKKNGYSYSIKAGWLGNKQINNFNAAIKKVFPGNYLDSNTMIKSTKNYTVDGIHYNASTYQKIYNFIKTYI